jgi:S1-C subfamily serine protease
MAENPSELYQRFKTCMVRIETVDSNGAIHSGAGFHIGNGLIATAQHVVDYRLEHVVGEYLGRDLTVREIHRHPNELVDLAVLETDFDIDRPLRGTTYHFVDGAEQPAIERHRQSVPLGGHLDDWIGDESRLAAH